MAENRLGCTATRRVRVSFIMQVGNHAPLELVERGIKTMLAAQGMGEAAQASVTVREDPDGTTS